MTRPIKRRAPQRLSSRPLKYGVPVYITHEASVLVRAHAKANGLGVRDAASGLILRALGKETG